MNERAPLPQALVHPPRGRVLVFSPHSDDDVIGCGGTCALHVAQGDPVRVIVVFDGKLGDPAGRFDPAELVELRRAEARRAGAHLGIRDYEFWAYPEGHTPADPEIVKAARYAAERLAAFAPTIVYAPWIGEHHLDHHVLARVARLALRLADFQGEAWGYEVWTPLVAERIVDITRHYGIKVAALREHKTQLAQGDLIGMGLSLSAHRAGYLPAGARHGEAFARLGAPWESDLRLVGLDRGASGS